ncbi:hypothetical protein HO173_004284 [Letharia columbiana]|uniref:Uncharacterized protein n=1 Tax=Letharia columbiana TaxID=112416 RepID=A0A8H6L6F9_9LECA|nr:uncharacterized protein HO173_004284 [Letharia columbiana]KAF6237394.1 hypothetical protein HO173_004284 [Letharia columbiana]
MPNCNTKPQSSHLLPRFATATHASGAMFNSTPQSVNGTSAHIQTKALQTDLNSSTTSATAPVASLTGVGDYSGVDFNAFSVLGDPLTGGIAS